MSLTPHEFLAHVATLCEDMDAIRAQAYKALSQADKSVSAIYHEIEMTTFDAAAGYRLARRLKEVLLHRRSIKRELKHLSILTPFVRNLTIRHRETVKRLARLDAENATTQSAASTA